MRIMDAYQQITKNISFSYFVIMVVNYFSDRTWYQTC